MYVCLTLCPGVHVLMCVCMSVCLRVVCFYRTDNTSASTTSEKPTSAAAATGDEEEQFDAEFGIITDPLVAVYPLRGNRYVHTCVCVSSHSPHSWPFLPCDLSPTEMRVADAIILSEVMFFNQLKASQSALAVKRTLHYDRQLRHSHIGCCATKKQGTEILNCLCCRSCGCSGGGGGLRSLVTGQPTNTHHDMLSGCPLLLACLLQ
eukprot:scpid53149/ scgid0668/ 